jgi:hypothetical protein
MHMIDLLASGVAHDFNNRLQSMASALTLAQIGGHARAEFAVEPIEVRLLRQVRKRN